MISEEAVEAAYGELPEEAFRYVNKARLRTILEAAAPYIAAQAWDEAASSIVDEYGTPIIPDSNTNPYRSQA